MVLVISVNISIMYIYVLWFKYQLELWLLQDKKRKKGNDFWLKRLLLAAFH